MIHEICKLHSRLGSDTELLIKMTRYDYECKIRKEDRIMKVDGHTLKVTRPSGEISLINTNYIMVVYYYSRVIF